MYNTTEDDQSPEQISKFVESEDEKSTLSSFCDLPPLQEASEFSSYGVDWSNRAESTSHCWLPYSSKNSSASHLCVYNSCKTGKSTSNLPLIQCATCSLIVHVAHPAISPCRPSFMDSSATDNLSKYDQHYWSLVPTLSLPCTHCQYKSFKPTVDDEASSDLVCLWCSRNYHQRCWKSITDDEDHSKCDYGKFGDIVVRPQWLHRTANSSFGFRAQMLDGLKTNHASSTPVIFFINKFSGGQKGQQVYRTLVRLLNPRQVFLLEDDTTIMQALNIYSSLENTRICICGGDGTVAWVLSRLADVFPSSKNPPASICPLGTGNDMSRALDWGHRYKPSQLLKTLTQISRAQPIILDRWRIQIEALETNAFDNESVSRRRRFLSLMDRPKFIRDVAQPFYDHHRTPMNTFFFNYISFGLDVAIVLDYHTRRVRDPSRFTSPLKNKMLCINESRKYFNDFVLGMAWNLSSYIRLICDGQDLTDSIRHCNSLVVLNTRSFGSGTHPWGRTSRTVERSESQDFGDRKIEVLGLNIRQMALIRLGFRGTRIAQCSQVRIELSHSMPVHMDGGPFHLAGSIAVNITHAGQVMVLRNETK